MGVNFVGNKVTRSEAIEIYTPNGVTSSRSRKTKIVFFANCGETKKIIYRAGPQLKFQNYESVQHRLE